MKQVLGIKDEAACLSATPPLAAAPLAHRKNMRWNPNDDGINFNPSGRYSPGQHCERVHASMQHPSRITGQNK